MKWFKEEIAEGENGIIIYPNLQTFRQIYTQYVKDQLSREEDEENNITRDKQLVPRIILIATFYETIDSVKHNLNAIDVDVQRHIDNGSLVIVDAFSSYYPDINGMKKLVA
jgi:hypothetical protein